MDCKAKNPQIGKKELRIVGPTTSTSPTLQSSSSPFKLPNDWIVEDRPRRSGHRSDRYYYEPGTGQQFRSLISIQKYLNGDTNASRRRKKTEHNKEKNMQIVPFKSSPLFNLPDGWIVHKRPRKNINYAGVIDKFYIERGTGRRFRSLISVEKYLTEWEGYTTVNEELKAGVKPSESSLGSSSSQKKHFSEEKVETSMLNFSVPPAKIKWVNSGLGGNVWSPFMDDALVPEPIKRKWFETFVLTLNDRF